jgi:hypothetical protein
MPYGEKRQLQLSCDDIRQHTVGNNWTRVYTLNERDRKANKSTCPASLLPPDQGIALAGIAKSKINETISQHAFCNYEIQLPFFSSTLHRY